VAASSSNKGWQELSKVGGGSKRIDDFSESHKLEL